MLTGSSASCGRATGRCEPTPRLALVCNEAAGAGDGLAVERALTALGAEIEPVPLARAGEAGDGRPDRVVVAGGDGSIGAVAEAAVRARIPLAVVPAGTANDFARRLGIPLELDDAARIAAAGTDVRRVDLARMEGRPFVNVASAGLSPLAAHEARGLKARLGRFAYVLGALRAAALARPLRCTVACDGAEVFAGRAWQVMVSNSGAFGGGSRVEAADPGDGSLDVTVIAAGPRLRLARHAYGLRFGAITGQEGVVHRRGREVEVDVPSGTMFNVDGELVAGGGTARFSVDQAALAVVVG